MAIMPRNRKTGTMVLVILIGLLVGAYLNVFFRELLPDGNVVRMLFTTPLNFGIGDFVNNKPLLVDLAAFRFQFGFQFDFSLLSIVGIFIGLYFFRWYE
jgi:hypothetical protein